MKAPEEYAMPIAGIIDRILCHGAQPDETPETIADEICKVVRASTAEARREALEAAAALMEATDPEKPSEWLIRREDAAQAIRNIPLFDDAKPKPKKRMEYTPLFTATGERI